jgi:hypothetical protein
MNKITVIYEDTHTGDTITLSEVFEQEHISYHVDVLRRALIAMTFSEALVEEYIPIPY